MDIGAQEGSSAATAATRGADELVGRIERLPVGPFHVRVGAILGLGSFFDSFDSLSLVVALTVIVTTLHISFVDVGFLISAAYVGMFVGAVVFGWVGETFGRKTAFVASVGLFGLLSLAAAFSWDFESLFWMRFVQGLALGGEVPIAAALFNEFLPARARGRSFFTGYALLFVFGLFIAPLAGYVSIRLLGPELGWRALFVFGGLALVLAGAAIVLLPESPRWLADKGRLGAAEAIVAAMEASAAAGGTLPAITHRYRADTRATRFAELFHGIYTRRTVLVWTQFFSTYFVLYGLTGWLPTLYVKLGGLPPRNALLLSVVTGAVMLVSVFVYGVTVDRIGRKPWFVFCYAMGILGVGFGVVAVAVFHATGWPVLFGASLVMAVGININASACYLYTPELFPTRMRAWATATGSAANRAGSFIAPALIGVLLQQGLGIGSVFLLLGLVCLLGLVATLALGIETSRRTLEDVAA